MTAPTRMLSWLAGAAALLALSLSVLPVSRGEEPKNAWTPLTADEEKVIVDKGTERPFTGKFVDHHEDGTYTCKRCGAALFPSSAKFNSKSGWPSFDQALPGAVQEVSDDDGQRTEIVCAHCGAHLGHVFRGEGFTDNDTRHCVNSVSLEFEAAAAPRTETAVFAGGCFWGVEYLLEQADGVLHAESGYTGGHVDNPSYAQVCDHTTGHVEAVRVTFDPAKTTYEALAKLFFEIHDPTQVDRQGPDVGEQYRSVVFFNGEAQKKTAEALIAQLEARGYEVATKLEPASAFWEAEGYHQDYYHQRYYQKKGSEPYCHGRVPRFGD